MPSVTPPAAAGILGRLGISRRFAVGFALGLVALAVNAYVTFSHIRTLIDATASVNSTLTVGKLFTQLQSSLIDGETGQRGYVLTGASDYLDPYYVSVRQAKGHFQALRERTAEDARVQKHLDNLEPLIEEKLRELEETIRLREAEGHEAAVEAIRGAQGKRTMDRIREIINVIEKEKELVLASRWAEADASAQLTIGTVSIATLINLCVLCGMFYIAVYDIRERRRGERDLAEANRRLAAGMATLGARNREMLTLSRMSELLQSCNDTGEALQVFSTYGAQLFPDHRATLYLLHPSRDLLETAAHWGAEAAAPRTFTPQECWALRRGQVHDFSDPATGLLCAHVEQDRGRTPPHLCLPLSAQGETIGLLTIEEVAGRGADRAKDAFPVQLATMFSDQMSLALANLQLRETLHRQSIHDVLTGLYNRRYFEESLLREFAVAERKGQPLAVIMLDVDHFKRFNDSFGHEAGDLVLERLGRRLRQHVRESDLACRWGGEEFVILMPDTTREVAERRIEALRQSLKSLELRHGNQALPPVTASFGIALYPAHAATPEDLVQAADAALYAAKRAGRDRVAVSGAASSAAVTS